MLPICVVLKALKKKIGGCGLFSFLLQRELKRHSQMTDKRVSTACSEPSPCLPSQESHAALSHQVFTSKKEHGGRLI